MDQFKEITSEELKGWMDKDKEFILIDVLSKESYNNRHLPGALNVPFGDANFIINVGDIAPSIETPIVVYCSSFDCQASPSAAGKLVDEGYENVYDFSGGLADWQDSGYTFEGE